MIYQCKDCKGSFETKRVSLDYDVTFCPYCGSEGIAEAGF